MTASEALERTNGMGYDYIVSRIVSRTNIGYDWMYLDAYLYDRFGEKLRSEGYEIKKDDCSYILKWSNPIVFNQ